MKDAAITELCNTLGCCMVLIILRLSNLRFAKKSFLVNENAIG